MGRVKGQKIEKREDRNRKIASTIANMEVGEMTSITPLSHSIKIHPYTLKDLLDLYDSLNIIGFKTIRDKDGKIVKILRVEKDTDIEKMFIEIKKDILDLKSYMKKEK